jgi:hypothetical protein
MVLRVSSSCLEYWVILSISSTYLPLGFPSGPRYVYGPGGRNRSGPVRAKGVTLAQNGVRKLWTLPVHSVAPGGGSGMHRGCQRSGSLTWSQVLTGW